MAPKSFYQIDIYLSYRNLIDQGKPIDWLLINAKSKTLKPADIYKCVTKYLSKVSTKEKISPHVLRHTFATHLLNFQGADINSIKEILGQLKVDNSGLGSSTQIYAKNLIYQLLTYKVDFNFNSDI